MKNLIEDKHEVNKVYKEIQITQGLGGGGITQASRKC